MSGRNWIVAALTVAFVTGAVVIGLAQGGEKSLPLHQCPTLEQCGWQGPEEFAVAGEICSDAWKVTDYTEFTLRLGANWDFLEMGLAIPDPLRKPMLVVFCGAKGTHEVRVPVGGRPKSVCIPVAGLDSLQVKTGNGGFLNGLMFVSPRLVRGRTASRPNDLDVVDGQIIYIDMPGQYRINVRH